MFKNYLKIILRNFLKHKAYSAINIIGLAIGIVCCVMILVYIQYELGYDSYHDDANRLYRLVQDRNYSGQVRQLATTGAPLAALVDNAIPEVESWLRFKPAGKTLVASGQKRFFEEGVFFADESVFAMMDFSLVIGNPKTVLQAPYSIVITEGAARKYFDPDEDPVGRRLVFDDEREYHITGVMQDVPGNSHFRFDFLASFSTLTDLLGERFLSHPGNLAFYTYFLLSEDADLAEVHTKMNALMQDYVGEDIARMITLRLQPLTSIHLHSKLQGEIEANSDVTHVYVFSAIALLVLLIAAFNFMNLSTMRSAKRAKEVGMRKVLGALKSQLVRQFLGESVATAIMALLLALLLIEAAMPVFNMLTGKQIELNYTENSVLLSSLLAIVLGVGLIAGLYPAFYLSAFRPVHTLKGKVRSGGRGLVLRRILVVAQFVISIGLIAGTIVIKNQLDFIRAKNLGFVKDHVVVTPVHEEVSSERVQGFKSRLLQHPQLRQVTAASGIPGKGVSSILYRITSGEGFDNWTLKTVFVDADFLTTLGIEIVEGRNFSHEFGTDESAFIVNETAAKQFGWSEPLGREIIWPRHLTRTDAASIVKRGPVIGVIRDFHTSSLHETIEPLTLQLGHGTPNYMAIRIGPDNVQQSVDLIRKEWQAFSPRFPFEYSFLDDDFDKLYRADQRVGQILGTFSFLAILVACLGLFGLAAFSAELRTKEIGIRKVLGAPTLNVLFLLVREFLSLIALASLLAAPVSFFAMRLWLQNFAYRIDLGALPFFVAALLSLVIALLTVCSQTIKAAMANAADTLRYE